MSVEVEFDGEFVTVSDINSLVSWVEAFKEILKEISNEFSSTYYERWDSLSKESEMKYSKLITDAFHSYRKNPDPDIEWKHYLQDALTEDDMDCERHDCAESAFYESKQLKNKVEECFDNLESECELSSDDVSDAFVSIVVDEIYQRDDSTIFDSIGDLRIPVIAIPTKPEWGSISYDDLSIDLDIETFARQYKNGDYGIRSLFTMLNMNPLDLLDSTDGLNLLDSSIIDTWIDVARDLKIPRNQSKISPSKLIDILNEGCRSEALSWCGSIEVSDFKKINPKEGIVLSGGGLGFIDFTNGAGFPHENDSNFSMNFEAGVLGCFGYLPSMDNASIRSIELKSEKKKVFSNDMEP